MTDRLSMDCLTIGFLGGGPVTQAIHLPALATMPDRWRVARVMDVDERVAQAVAGRCGAQATTDPRAILDDPDIDAVAVCSPNSFHADQVIAACRAGKRAVLCEKPLAVSREEADAIVAIAAETGTAIMVGTMHRYDPAFQAALADWTEAGEPVISVKSSIFLPPNAMFVDYATQEVPSDTPPPPRPAPPPPPERLRQTILGLAIHHVPLVRSFYPAVGSVLSARHIPPFGYSLFMADGDRQADMLAFMPGQWPPSWTFQICGRERHIDIDFPPSYVLAGSGTAISADRHGSRSFRSAINGYQAQWLHLHDIVTGRAAPLVPLAEAVEDLQFALDLADRAATCLEAAQ